MEIPYTELSESTLIAIIEEFVSREGTDYGLCDQGFVDKVSQVRQQLEKGIVTIVFSAEQEVPHIIPKSELKSIQSSQ